MNSFRYRVNWTWYNTFYIRLPKKLLSCNSPVMAFFCERKLCNFHHYDNCLKSEQYFFVSYWNDYRLSHVSNDRKVRCTFYIYFFITFLPCIFTQAIVTKSTAAVTENSFCVTFHFIFPCDTKHFRFSWVLNNKMNCLWSPGIKVEITPKTIIRIQFNHIMIAIWRK